MKNKILKFSYITIIVFCVALFATAQQQYKKETNANIIGVRHADTLVTSINKDDIVKWLKDYITPGTPVRNKFITDILQNALFTEMYLQRKNSGDNGKVLIVPLKNSYFSQHISKSGQMPFQNLLIDIDKINNTDKIFTIDLSLIYPADSKIKSLPKNTLTNFWSQYETLDGTYTLISIILADYKFTDIDIKNSERVRHRSWSSKKTDNDLYEWVLETDDIVKDKDGFRTKIITTTQKLGTSKTVSPPMFKGDLRTKEYEK